MIFNNNFNLRTSLSTAIVNIRRNISVVITGGISQLNILSNVGLPTNSKDFEKLVADFLQVLKLYYPLTNKSSLFSTLLAAFKLIVVFPFIMSTQAYEFLLSSGRSVELPTGFAKFMDYICIPTRKSPDLSDSNSLISTFKFKDNLSEFLEFLDEYYLIQGKFYTDHELASLNARRKPTDLPIVNSIDVETCHKNIERMVKVITDCGYRTTHNDLVHILQALRSWIGQIENVGTNNFYNTIFDFMNSLKGHFIKLNTSTYAPTASSTSQLRLSTFRASGSIDTYYVMYKHFVGLIQASQQILVIALFLFRPSFILDGSLVSGRNVQDGTIDLSFYTRFDVLRALFSIETIKTGDSVVVEEQGIVDESDSTLKPKPRRGKPKNKSNKEAAKPAPRLKEVRSYSTMVSSTYHTKMFPNYFDSNRVVITKPLKLTLRDLNLFDSS
jgi:hypothetical protein